MATNTAASFTNHTGNGTAGPFNISFSYLSEAEVDVTVGGVLKTITTHYTFTSATQITFTSGNEPANGVAIKFQRDTNISAKKVDFADGSVLTEADLDANSDQVLFAQQEIIDKLGGIEEGATGDQTAAEIRTLVESASDSNVFTDADHDKLNAIEPNATQDQTISEIKTLIAGSPLDASHLAANSVNTSELADDSVTYSKLQNVSATDRVLGRDSSGAGVVEEITPANLRTMINVEDGATADQSNAEIKTAYEANSNTNAFTDTEKSKLASIEASADVTDATNVNAAGAVMNSDTSTTAMQFVIDEDNFSSDLSTKVPTQQSTKAYITTIAATKQPVDTELTTLSGMQSATASKLADSTALTSDIADLNQLDGMAKQTTITDDDTKFPTSGAVVDFVAAQIAPLGGLEVVATDAAFPNTQPSAGVVISISDAGGVAFNGSGTSTTPRTVGGSTVTINNAPSSLNNETLVAGVGLMVSSTGSGQIYNYHKILGKEDDIKQLSDDINDFNARYRVGSSNPTSALDAGDLFFNTSTSKLLVYNATNSAWEEAQSIGNFFISTFSESVDGSRQDFTVSNAPANAQQILLSINGVIQKPNSGTSTPSEGFALSGSTVKLAAAPPSGSDIFIVVLGSTVNIGTPSNNTVTSAILQNGSVTTAKITDANVTTAKIADSAITSGKIADGAIVNADINASAAIAGTKISPDFGSQAITTTGNVTSGHELTISGTDPRITFVDTNNDPDFQIWANAQKFQIFDYTNSATRLLINSSGKIGVGTTTPLARLHVLEDVYAKGSSGDGSVGIQVRSGGSAISNQHQIRTGGGTGQQLFIEALGGSSALVTKINGSERLRIDSSGRLLIGHSANRAINTHAARLQIQGTDYSSSTVSIINNANSNNGAYLFFAKQRSGSAGGSTIINDGDIIGQIRWNGADGTNLEVPMAYIECRQEGTPAASNLRGSLRIYTNGGGTSPTERLQIEPTGSLRFVGSSSRQANTNSICSSGGNSIDVNVTEYFYLRSGNSTEILRARNNGNVSIGTTNTTHRFTSQNTSATQIAGFFLSGSTSYSSTTLQSNCSRNTSNGSYTHFKCAVNGVADKFRVLDSGAIQSTSNSIGGISDERLKENIVDAGSQWNDIKNIRVRKFNFKKLTDPEQKTMLGVVAQEAELVCPNLVESTVQLQEGVEQEYKSFKYSILYMKAIKALQEAQARIETLEAKVFALEAA